MHFELRARLALAEKLASCTIDNDEIFYAHVALAEMRRRDEDLFTNAQRNIAIPGADKSLLIQPVADSHKSIQMRRKFRETLREHHSNISFVNGGARIPFSVM